MSIAIMFICLTTIQRWVARIIAHQADIIRTVQIISSTTNKPSSLVSIARTSHIIASPPIMRAEKQLPISFKKEITCIEQSWKGLKNSTTHCAWLT